MASSRARCVIDTNVVVYARQAGSTKCETARRVLRRCAGEGSGALTTQVLLETYAVLSRQENQGAERRALDHVGRLSIAFRVLPATAETVLLAADCSQRHRMHPFDATLWASAFLEGLPVVLTEDLQHGLSIDGVTFLNPFAEDFDEESTLSASR